jgi:transcription elongation factor GreA
LSEKRELILTASGFRRIEAELDQLQSVRRQEVANHIREAMAFGDIAENPEYESAKNEQAFVEGRIIELKSILNAAQVIDESKAPTDVVGIGSVVTVKDLEMDEQWDYTIVGSVEADPDEDRISNESPIGEALLGQRKGDVVEFKIPVGIARYEIVDIRRASD